MVHLITFELEGPRMPGERHRMEQAIKALGPSFAFAPATWIVESEMDNRDICERLRPFIRPTDRIVSTRIYRDWVAANIPEVEREWLGSRNFTAIEDAPKMVRRIPTVRE